MKEQQATYTGLVSACAEASWKPIQTDVTSPFYYHFKIIINVLLILIDSSHLHQVDRVG